MLRRLFVFVVPNRRAFEQLRLQPYKLREQCPHACVTQCQECASNDNRVEQFALLCEVKGWEDFTFEDFASAPRSEELVRQSEPYDTSDDSDMEETHDFVGSHALAMPAGAASAMDL